MKQFLLTIFVLLLLNADIKAQNPSIAYPATANLTPGVHVSITPVSSGVPATAYGSVTTFSGPPLGPGNGGNVNSTATLSRYNDIEAIAGDSQGNIYIAEVVNNDIRKIAPDGSSIIWAGSPSGMPGFQNGDRTTALFSSPDGIAVDANDNLFIGDYDNNVIREIRKSDGQVITYANLVTGASGLSFDKAGNLWVTEQGTSQIQMITPAGVITTVAGTKGIVGTNDGTGTAARFNDPNDVQADWTSGNVIVADYLNNSIRQVTPQGVVTTIAGSTIFDSTGIGSYVDGPGTIARFYHPTGVVTGSGGIIYVSDLKNSVIRRIMPDGTVSTVAGTPSPPANVDGVGLAARFTHPVDMYIDPTGIGYVIDGQNKNIRKIILTGYSISGALPPGLSFDPATGTISGTPTGTFPKTTYTVTAFNTTGYTTATITLTTYNSWKGTGADWNIASNWSLNTIPGPADIVQIGVVPYTGNIQPNVGANTSVGSIEFGPNNAPILTIKLGQALTVGNGIQVDAASTVNINGPGNINLSGASVVNPTGALTAGLNLTITLGALSTLTNNGTFTLASDADGSASIAAIPSGSAVNGQVSVQRYISGRRGYRLTSSPVYDATAITSNKVYSINYVIKSTFVTGYSDTAGGFDSYGNPSMYFYRENMTPTAASFTSTCYRALQSIANSPNYTLEGDLGTFNLPVGNGYMFYFRGPRSTPNPYDPASVPAPTALTATGTLNQGTIVVKDWFTPTADTLSYTASSPDGNRGFNLVGNPYPSSIDWDKFSNAPGSGITGTASLAPFIYVRLPNGAFATYGSGYATDPSVNNIIPSGEGFFVQATGPGAKLTFNESAKISAQVSSANLTMSTAAVPKTNVQYLRLQMALDTFDKENTLISFNTVKTAFDPKIDAVHLQGTGKVSLSSLSSDHVQLAINQLPLPKLQSQVIALNVAALESGTYHLSMDELVGVPRLYDIWLTDNYKKDSVNMRVTNIYNFNVNNTDTTSFGAKRFSLVIKQNPAYAYRLLDFNANKVPTAHQVNVFWKTQYEENYTNFTVERSIDGGNTFTVLGGVSAAGQGSYTFLDKNPVNGQDLYRLKQEDINNTISYSKIVGIFYSDLSNNILSSKISIFPNPVNSNINVAFAAETNESSLYDIRFMSSTGLVVKEITSSQPSWQGTISNLQPGTYIVRVVNNKTQSLVGENKFVKL